mmetsp:Transcript_39545/g.82144  ORF Transcript_39545/g.82144 Transcript_39545/m.82144 type:complete len:113 (+) Transcript_39545:982-1320(+)
MHIRTIETYMAGVLAPIKDVVVPTIQVVPGLRIKVVLDLHQLEECIRITTTTADTLNKAVVADPRQQLKDGVDGLVYNERDTLPLQDAHLKALMVDGINRQVDDTTSPTIKK